MTAKLYSSYKDSGSIWLNKVPAHWKVAPLKRLLNIQNGADQKAVESEEGYPIYGSGGIFGYANQYLYDGKSVLLGRKGTIDKPLFVDGKFWTVDTMYWSKILSTADPKFSYYLSTRIPFDFYSTSTALPSMTKADLGSHIVAYPEVEEQQRIANYLDRETAKIDELIQKQEKLIGFIDEEKNALITESLTRGLNDGVIFENSGNAFIRQVPSHWSVRPLKSCLKPIKGALRTGPFGSELTAKDILEIGDIKIYNQRTVIDDDYLGGQNYISQDKFESLKSFESFPGDILVTTRGTIGRASIVPENAKKGILHPCLIRIQLNENLLLPEYLLMALNQSNLLISQLAYLSNSTTIEVIYSYTIANVSLPIPPIAEQKEILLFLNNKIKKIDILRNKAHSSINLLKEHRASLISAAVTGKIMVSE